MGYEFDGKISRERACRARLCLGVVLALVWVAPGTSAPQGTPVGVRLIAVGSESAALELRTRILNGESFDQIAREHSTDATSGVGGYLGRFVIDDMRPEFRDALLGISPGGVSLPVGMGSGYLVLGILNEAEQEWTDLVGPGLQALDPVSSKEEAETLLESALRIAGPLGAGDFRFLLTLKTLADLYHAGGADDQARPLYEEWADGWDANPLLKADAVDVAARLRDLAFSRRQAGDFIGAEALARRALGVLDASSASPPEVASAMHDVSLILGLQQRYAEAEVLARESLAVFEANLDPGHPALSESLANLARLLQAQGQYEEPARLYRRALGILARLPEESGGEGLGPLELMTRALERSPLREEAFEDALTTLREAFQTVGSDLAVAISSFFAQRDLNEAAEQLLRDTVARYPDSRVVLGELGTLLETEGRIPDATDTFVTASRMPPAEDSSVASAWTAYFLRKVGDLRSQLLDFSEAEAAYRGALQLQPSSAESRVGLGLVFFMRGDLEAARAEYGRALEINPNHLTAHFRMAEVDLGLERFGDAVSSASAALAIDPAYAEARFVRARALMLTGETEEGTAESTRYLELETERKQRGARSSEARSRSREGLGLLGQGDFAGAERVFQAAVETYPDFGELYMALGEIQIRTGQSQAAISTFQKMIAAGLGDFVVHKSLSEAYARVGEMPASQEHELEWLLGLYTALRERL